MWADHGEYFESGGLIHFDAVADGIPDWPEDETTSRVLAWQGIPSGPNIGGRDAWTEDDGDSFSFWMACGFASEAARLHFEAKIIEERQTEPGGLAINFGLGMVNGEQFFAYADARPLYECMGAEVEVQQLTGESLNDVFPKTDVALLEETHMSSQAVLGRTFEIGPYPSLSPNHMFHIFNVKD